MRKDICNTASCVLKSDSMEVFMYIIVGIIAFVCFACLYEYISGKAKMSAKGIIICSVLGISMVIAFLLMAGMELITSVVLTIVIIIIGVICGYIFKDKKEQREKITPNAFNNILILKQYDRLWNKREDYLKAFEENEEYYVLNEFYNKLGNLINDYKREILNTPLRLTKPVNPYTAAYFGTQIGGIAVGMVAAQNAIEKEKAYQKNVTDVIVAELKTGNAYDKVEYCYQSIETILSQNEYTNNDWNEEKQLIKDEMNKKYKKGTM